MQENQIPKNQINDPITAQEIAFAHLILSGTMTDRRAAEAVGLDPNTAAYIKAKPRVQAYMLEHQAAMHQERVQQDTEEPRPPNVIRERVLARLWEIADLSHEATRNSASAQIKALSLIISIEGLIPDRRAGFSEKKPTSPPPILFKAPWLRDLQAKAAGLQPSPDTSSDMVPDEEVPADPGSTPGPDVDSGESIFARHVSPAETTPPASHAPAPTYAPNMRVPYAPIKNPYARGR